jgi:hypothetical protein
VAKKTRWVDGAGYMQTDLKIERFLRDMVKVMKKHNFFLGPNTRSGLMVYLWDEQDETVIMDASVHDYIAFPKEDDE